MSINNQVVVNEPKENVTPTFSKAEIEQIVRSGIAKGVIPVPESGTKLYKHKLVIVFAGTTYNGSTTKTVNLHYLSPSSKEPVTIDNYKTALRASDIIGVDGWTFTLSGNIGWFQKIDNKLRTSGTTQTGDYEFTSEEYGIQFTSSGIRTSGDSFRSYCSLTLKRADSTFTFSNSSNTNFTAVNSITDTVEEL